MTNRRTHERKFIISLQKLALYIIYKLYNNKQNKKSYLTTLIIEPKQAL